MTPSFDLGAISLEPATTLIEASAGTGKTHSITGLIIRLLLEQDVKINEIVAVTFTEAATKELRERVRRRLAAALDDLRSGASGDPLLQRYLAGGALGTGKYRLNRALHSFDEAQIFTIHGFCQRCLGDYAFESGTPFESNLSGDSTHLFEEIARDFWRTQFWLENQLLAALTISWRQSPARWARLLQQESRHPGLVTLPPATGLSSTELSGAVETAFAAVRLEWQQHKAQIEQILRDDKGLSRAKRKDAFHPKRVAEILAKLTLCCERFECSAPDCIGTLADVCADVIEAGTKGQGLAPTHRFFELCGDFCRAVTNLFRQLDSEFLLYAQTELPLRKARTNTVFYDDLILGLRDALQGERGPALAQLIGRRYRAALVDEFQDTDPAQYEIFRTIFGAGRHCLFFIGDPKQAIFGFRGADIFTYGEASRQARERACTLTTNWRSEPRLLSALNALFQQTPHPFVFDWIEYHEVHPPAEPKVVPLLGPGAADAALRFRLLPERREGKKVSAADLVLEQLVADLSALHDSGARLGERRLCYRDFAVLVRRNLEAQEVQAALAAAGIRGILRTESNVFATPEAEELQRFLRGVLEPRRDHLLKGALVTPLLGLNASELFALELDEQKRQGWLGQFLAWQAQWVQGCFIAMFRQLLVDQSVRARLIRLPGGERRLTNFLHLAELLHEAETTRHLAPDVLVAFFTEQRAHSWTAEEQYQIRLESDADAVQIVTVHKAKGLEYPVVFCPFFWKRAESKHQELLFHDRDQHNRLTVDARGKKGGEARHRAWQSEETWSEELRLTYVALTRAMNRCYIYLPDGAKSLESPLAHLLGADATHLPEERLKSFLAAAPPGSVNVSAPVAPPARVPAADIEPPLMLAARKFTGKIPLVGLTASFTGLNADVELDRDAHAASEAEPAPSEAIPAPADPTIFSFPKGARAGDFFHDVLEHLDFATADQLEPLVSAKLRLHGVAGQKFCPAISTTLRNLSEVELAPGLRLNAVPPAGMLRELEFTHALKAITPAAVREVLAHCPGLDAEVSARMGRLRFYPVEGFMRGFIDGLFRWQDRFYLVDWKSNWLGGQPAAYGPAGMQAAMLKHNYFLQFHLYTLAADLFLRARVPSYSYERHFGGMFYIFLRGVDACRPDQGIFRARPAAETVEALHRLLP